MFIPRTPTSNRGSSGSSYIFSLCRLLSINRVSQHHVFFLSVFPFLPSLLPSLLPFLHSLLSGFIFFDASPYDEGVLGTPVRSVHRSLPFRTSDRSSSITFFDSHSTHLNPQTADLYDNIGRCRVWRRCLTISRTGLTSKGFGHDGHDTGVNPASVQRQFIPCLCSFFFDQLSLSAYV